MEGLGFNGVFADKALDMIYNQYRVIVDSINGGFSGGERIKGFSVALEQLDWAGKGDKVCIRVHIFFFFKGEINLGVKDYMTLCLSHWEGGRRVLGGEVFIRPDVIRPLTKGLYKDVFLGLDKAHWVRVKGWGRGGPSDVD